MIPALAILDRWGFNTTCYLLAALWQSSILFMAVLLLNLVLRRHAHGARRALWLAALLIAPALPLMSSLAKPSGLSQRAVVTIPAYEPAFPREAGPAAPPAQEFQALPTPVSRPSDFPWAMALLIYGTGVTAFFAWTALGHVRIRQWIRSGAAITEPTILQLFERAAELLRSRYRGRVVLTNRVPAPLTAGILRPVVLLPSDIARALGPNDLFAVALHETVHIKQREPLMLTLAGLVRCILFFHPLVWLACRRLAVLAEDGADDAVLAITGAPVDYAKLLVTFAERLPVRTPATEGAAGLVFCKSAFLKRVETILGDRTRIRRLTRLAAAGTVAAAVLSLAGALALPLGTGERGSGHTPELMAAAVEPAPPAAEPGQASDMAGLKLQITDGTHPIADAQVVLARPGYWIYCYDGKFTGDSTDYLEHGKRGKAPVAMTDNEGRCELPGTDGPFVVAAVHPSGYAVCTREDLLARNGAVTLSPWAVLDGTVHLSDMPLPNAPVLASATYMLDRNGRTTKQPGADAIEIGFICQGHTDKDARFNVSGLPAGDVTFSPGYPQDANGEFVAVNGLNTVFTVSAGQTLHLNFGDSRWTVTGRLGPGERSPDWSKFKANLRLEALHVGLPSDDAVGKIQADFAKSAMGKLYFRDVAIGPDGSFTVDNVPEGHYQFLAFEPSGASFASSKLEISSRGLMPETTGRLTIDTHRPDVMGQSIRVKFIPDLPFAESFKTFHGAAWSKLHPFPQADSLSLRCLADAEIGDQFPVQKDDGPALFEVLLKAGDDNRVELEIMTDKDTRPISLSRDHPARMTIGGVEYTFTYPSIYVAPTTEKTKSHGVTLFISTPRV